VDAPSPSLISTFWVGQAVSPISANLIAMRAKADTDPAEALRQPDGEVDKAAYREKLRRTRPANSDVLVAEASGAFSALSELGTDTLARVPKRDSSLRLHAP
jgi:hypothetical protein